MDLYHIELRYDTIGEFNVDSIAEYSALSSTRSQKKETNTISMSSPGSPGVVDNLGHLLTDCQ